MAWSKSFMEKSPFRVKQGEGTTFVVTLPIHIEKGVNG
jgi:hypothetical protein